MQIHYQICSRCVMMKSDPDIVFDDQGICNHCKNWYVSVNVAFSRRRCKSPVDASDSTYQGEGKE